MFRTGGKIKDALKKIEDHTYVLPAIQREFVWDPSQICQFFDSLMQGYPFGTFLFWQVDPGRSDWFKFYDFVRDYHERDNPHCPPLAPIHNRHVTAVLDGQQRLTALNIGLRGSMAQKLPYKWRNNPDAFPIRHLYLDLLADFNEEESGQRYAFDFLTEEDLRKKGTEAHCWYRVSEILRMAGGPDLMDWLNPRIEKDSMPIAFRTLDQLYQVIHNKEILAFFEEIDQDLDKVLNIFIRMNSGGTELSYSDLLLSIAVAQWTNLDARKEIHALVDEMNRTGDGFDYSKDLVLKAGLMLSDIGNVGFKVENFNRANMQRLEEDWPGIKRALLLTVRLISSFGFNDQSIRAYSAMLPITYYIYRRNLDDSYLTSTKYQSDREALRHWLIRSLLKASGIWGSGLDTLLTALRGIIRDHGQEAFPIRRISEEMAKRGKQLDFNSEEIKDLADIRYGDKRVFSLLSLLFPFVDLRNQVHIDHVFPRSRFTDHQLLRSGVPETDIKDYKEMRDGLANLQLLDSAFNIEKRQTLPSDWLKDVYPSPSAQQNHIERHLLGDVPETLAGFGKYYAARRSVLTARIESLLASSENSTQSG